MYEEMVKAVESLSSYEILKNEELTDVSSRGMLLRHKKSGAHVALVINDDNNKTFSIGFRTPVEDSTGVPHIIEHSVLCGSDKYPVKDPFMELVKGSLNTFLNAMTYGDRTLYPVASCNDKDFENLMGVYMDAVFHPLIYSRPEIFRQEGIRFDIGEKGELLYNGVVYNEMKGAMSRPERVLYQKGLEGLFPDTTYGNNSGGDPAVIRTLTYDKFLAFHKRYYHPSNSYIALYGDFNVKERLEWMDENYLSRYDAIDPDSEIKKQDPARSNRNVEDFYPLGEKEDDKNKAYLSINFIVGDETTAVENAACGIILDTLIGKNGAPVWQAVMESGICEDFSCWMDTDLRQPMVSMEAKNADPVRKEEFAKIIKDALAKEIEKGLNKKTIMALINRREFEYLEADSASTPRGIVFLLDMYGKWIY
ncbi:MAG: insulinase family protein, partial [Lachnospiraceae bacterium]|nr:insulinase family protein [Lachnospiraceae bacterium]